MKKYDIHMHSYYSPCSRNTPENILKYAKKAGLNGIAITDHHTIACYARLKKLNRDKNFEIICGSEITTEYGDVIALYIKKDIKSRKFFEVVKEIKSQGGLVIIPHPFRHVPWLKFKYPLSKLKGKIDAIETFNSRNMTYSNVKAVKEAQKLRFAQTGSSDGHLLMDIGKGYTIFEGSSLRQAIKDKKTIVGGNNKYGMISAAMSSLNKRVLTPILGKHTDKYSKTDALKQSGKYYKNKKR